MPNFLVSTRIIATVDVVADNESEAKQIVEKFGPGDEFDEFVSLDITGIGHYDYCNCEKCIPF